MLTYKNVNRISFLLLFITIYLIVNDIISFIWILAIGFLWLTLITIGSFHIRWNFFLKAYHKNENVLENVISLTFDDGPNNIYTLKVLDLLKKYNFKATFFLIGSEIEKNNAIVKEILNQGHTIGNHTYSHTNNFGFYKTNEVINDLKKNNKLIEELFNLKVNLYRPAFGVTNPRIAKAIKTLNLTTIGWSVRSLDTTSNSKEKIVNRITKNLKKGDIVLLHDTSQKTIEVLEQLLIFLNNKNWKSITVDQLLTKKAYA